jgi:hypothetical protein
VYTQSQHVKVCRMTVIFLDGFSSFLSSGSFRYFLFFSKWWGLWNVSEVLWLLSDAHFMCLLICAVTHLVCSSFLLLLSVVHFVTLLGRSYGWHGYVCSSAASSYHPLVFWSLHTAHVSHSSLNFFLYENETVYSGFSFPVVGLLLLRALVFHISPDKSLNNLFLQCRHLAISDSKLFLQCRHFEGFRFETVHNRYIKQKNIFQPPVTRFLVQE